jgi:hypothetical protein
MNKGRSMVRWAMALVLACAATVVLAAEVDPDRRVETVQFAQGEISVAISAVLQGRNYVDYQIRGGANQTLGVTLKSKHSMNYFNVNPPGSEMSMFVGSLSGNQFKRLLPADGVYTIRVYLMRAAARRNETARYTLTVSLQGTALKPVPPSKDALIRGTPFHASASIACARQDMPMQRCDANVIRRDSGGTGTVEVVWPGGFKRNILFVKLHPMASDSRDEMTFSRQGDVTTVSIGKEERVDIPDALIAGG